MTYYPYLRGRQNELIALRELATNELISENTIPIIEPLSVTSTFLTTLKAFRDKNLKIAIIMNPEYGDFFQSTDKEDIKNEIMDLLEEGFIIKAFIMKKGLDISMENLNNLLIINKNHDSAENFFKCFHNGKYPEITLIPDDRMFKRKLNSDNKVLLEDCFHKQSRNADYQNEIDEFFSDGLQLTSEGFQGFSDYSIVGKEYVEGGFAPTAVAIHIVYENRDSELRIRHFVSDNNFDIGNVAGKYGEAVGKLCKWCRDREMNETKGLQYFYESYETGKFPGLGVAKRWSIMHHIELVDKLLKKSI